MKTKSKYPLLSFDVIQSAVNGDSTDIKVVLHHYERYVIKLSMRPCRDENGTTNMTVDPELFNRMQGRLMDRIMKFKIY